MIFELGLSCYILEPIPKLELALLIPELFWGSSRSKVFESEQNQYLIRCLPWDFGKHQKMRHKNFLGIYISP